MIEDNTNLRSCSDDDADAADIHNKESEYNESYLDHQMDNL